MSVQAVKDTFYQVLRDRVAAGNQARTVVVRGVVRPGVVVAENELPGAAVDGIGPAEAFQLRWAALRSEGLGAGAGVGPLVTLGCEIRYVTDGSGGVPGAGGGAGLDRGRALAAMDGELLTALTTEPQSAAQTVFAEIAGGGVSNGTATGTRIFWSDVTWKPAVMRGERMERTAEVEVFGYE